MKMSVPLSAPVFDPVTGESTYFTPLGATRSAKCRVAEGEMVLESAMIMPSASDGSTPLAPNNTLSTAAVSERHIQTTSTPCAASAGDAVLRAPSTLFLGVRFHTVTSCPAL